MSLVAHMNWRKTHRKPYPQNGEKQPTNPSISSGRGKNKQVHRRNDKPGVTDVTGGQFRPCMAVARAGNQHVLCEFFEAVFPLRQWETYYKSKGDKSPVCTLLNPSTSQYLQPLGSPSCILPSNTSSKAPSSWTSDTTTVEAEGCECHTPAGPNDAISPLPFHAQCSKASDYCDIVTLKNPHRLPLGQAKSTAKTCGKSCDPHTHTCKYIDIQNILRVSECVYKLTKFVLYFPKLLCMYTSLHALTVYYSHCTGLQQSKLLKS